MCINPILTQEVKQFNDNGYSFITKKYKLFGWTYRTVVERL